MPSSEYMREYMKSRRQSRRENLVELLGGKCAVCGSTSELEINHVDPSTKEFGLSGCALDKSWKAILIEVEKCNLLCKSHHLEYTRGQWGDSQLVPWNKDKIQETREYFGFPHGSAKRYNELGCRCDHCRRGRNLYRNGLAKFSEVVSAL